mgnify:CR=1 FL=1
MRLYNALNNIQGLFDMDSEILSVTVHFKKPATDKNEDLYSVGISNSGQPFVMFNKSVK